MAGTVTIRPGIWEQANDRHDARACRLAPFGRADERGRSDHRRRVERGDNRADARWRSSPVAQVEGKTSTLDSVFRIVGAKGVRVALAAPTGRAAKRITDTPTCRPCAASSSI